MNAYKAIKGITGLVVSAGAGAIVTNAIKATTPEDVKTLKKISIVIGTFAVSGVVADAAVKYSNKSFDDVKDAYDQARGNVHNITVVQD
jgi:hypothetical protein